MIKDSYSLSTWLQWNEKLLKIIINKLSLSKHEMLYFCCGQEFNQKFPVAMVLQKGGEMVKGGWGSRERNGSGRSEVEA